MSRIGVGTSDFEKLRVKDCYYVDKTEILYDIVENNAEVNLFTRPRRFGKTLMMSMIENFFNIKKDSRKLFERLNIMNHPEFCNKYMNQYPVLFVTLKDVEGNNYKEAYDVFVEIISVLCSQVSNLVDNEKVSSTDKNIFKKLESGTANLAQMKNSLVSLMSILHAVYDKKVILLIDEYDVPVAKAYNNDDGTYYKEMLQLIRAVLSSALKDGQHLEFAVVTGCLRIARESIFTGTNNFSNFSILDETFTNYFGFTEGEVKDLLDSIGCADKLPLVREWYDGYLFGNDYMYCPWDVINYVAKLVYNKDAIPRNFWQNTSSNDLLTNFVQHGYRVLDNIDGDKEGYDEDDYILTEQFNSLLQGEEIYIDIQPELTYDMVHSSINNIWTILLMTGYVTPTSLVTEYDAVGVKLPNKEIANLFESSVIRKFKTTLDHKKQRSLLRALWGRDSSEATKYLSSLLDESISCFDYYECFYHAFLAGIFSGLGYKVRSNREVGIGRADMIIQDKLRKRAILIETKRTSDEKKIETMCNEAMEQIVDNGYANSLKEEYPDVICYGIAFCKKSALVKLLPE